MMGRRAGLVTVAVAAMLAATLGATGSAAGDPGTEKARVDSEIGRLRDRAAAADQQAGVLTEELSAVAGRVRELRPGSKPSRPGSPCSKDSSSQARARLASLDRTIATQTARLDAAPRRVPHCARAARGARCATST